MRERDGRTEYLGVRLSPEEKEKLEMICLFYNGKQSDVIRAMILNEYEHISGR